MNNSKNSVRTLTMLALLVAMSIVFSRVLSISTGFVRFNLGSLPVLLAGLLFGCGLSEGAALLMFRQTGIMLSPQLTLAEGSFAAASFALGSLCALFPAYMVYRKTGAVALGDSE